MCRSTYLWVSGCANSGWVVLEENGDPAPAGGPSGRGAPLFPELSSVSVLSRLSPAFCPDFRVALSGRW